MKKSAIILHGRATRKLYYDPSTPSMSNSDWLPWLQKQLLVRDIMAHTPEIPLSFEPKWEPWLREVERYEITPQTILVGHSAGGGFWVRYLSEHPKLQVGKVLLVAPWIDVEEDDPNGFMDFKVDPDIAERTKGLAIFHLTDDGDEIKRTVRVLRSRLNDISYREFEGRGHFTHRYMPEDEFPELLEEIPG